MVDVTFNDLEGWEAILLIKLVDMFRAADKFKDKVVRNEETGEWVSVRREPVHPETRKNVDTIARMVHEDPLY